MTLHTPRRALLASVAAALTAGCTGEAGSEDAEFSCQIPAERNFQTGRLSILSATADALSERYECTVDLQADPTAVDAVHVREATDGVVAAAAVTDENATVSWRRDAIPADYRVSLEALADGERVDEAALRFSCEHP